MQKPNGAYASEPPVAKNEKGKPVNSENKVIKRVMPTDQPLTFWYKRKGYNDFLVCTAFGICKQQGVFTLVV